MKAEKKFPRVILQNRIRRYRKSMARILPGFRSQSIVASLLGRSGAWLSLVEAGKLKPSIEDALMLARIFHVPVEDLFYLTSPAEGIDNVLTGALNEETKEE